MIASHLEISLAEASFDQIWEEIKLRADNSILCVLHNNNEDWHLYTDGTYIELCGLIEIIKRRQDRMANSLLNQLETTDESEGND